MAEIYISTDIETDGPIPGPNSMLSLGSAAFSADGALLSVFTANFRTLEGASPCPETAKWWATQPEAWEACRANLRDPGEAMEAYSEWLGSLPGKPVFVGFPAGFDFLFVYWYLIRFTGKSPFSFSALDGKTYAMALMGTEYRKSVKRNYPKSWLPKGRKHTHVALDDAIEQGLIFCNMMASNKNTK
jgi:hypothetical protein